MAMNDINVFYQTDDNSFLLSHTKVSGHSNMRSNHFHSEYEIYYLLSGERYHFISDRTYHVKPGDIVFINTFDLHRTSEAGIPNHERMLIRFKKDFWASNNDIQNVLHTLFDSNHNIIRLGVTEQNIIENLFSKMLQEVQSRQTGCETLLKSLLAQLLVFCCRNAKQNTFNSFEHPSEVHKRVSAIAQYINANYRYGLTLASLSEKFFVSPYYLTRIFKNATGFTIVEYINNIRIKQAQKFLIDTKWKMDKISESCGFGSTSSFGRVFKSITGCSPVRYRSINKN